MKVAQFLLMLCLVSLAFAQAQTLTTPPVKRVAVSNVSIQTGFIYTQETTSNLEDYKTLAPQSHLLQQDFSSFSSISYQPLTTSPYISVCMGLQFGDKQKTTYKKNPILRLGLTYLGGKTMYSIKNKVETYAYDTLVSLQTGQQYFIDSVSYRQIRTHYSYEQLLIDAALLYRTNPSARWSLSIGVGGMARFSLKANANISYSKSEQVSTPRGINFYSQYYGFSQSEILKSNTNMGLSAYIPMGIDMRIANKNTFWNKIHLFYEVRPTIGVLKIQQLPTIVQSSIQQGFGIKVAI